MSSKHFLSILILLVSMACSSIAFAAELDVSKAKQLCSNATAQQKQMAKAAGYNLDELCSQLNGVSQSSGAEVVNETIAPRQPTTAGLPDSVTSSSVENPLAKLTPQQLAALSPAQIEVLLNDYADQLEAIEKEKQTQVDLEPFGYQLFAGEPNSFEPATAVPVPTNYVIGPGDVFEVQMFGKTSQQLSLTVNREGQIQFPELGPISLSGLTFQEAKQLLATRIKQQMIGVDSSISLGALRSIQVFLLGEVYKPGAYTVSSLSTITNALFVGGGLNNIASLRQVQLKRSGKLIAELDLYDLLLRGDTSKDQRLLPGDVVYVPPVGDTVSIAGAVKRPAIYELKNERSVKQLINMAGGLSATAFKQSAELIRVDQAGFSTVIDVTNPKESALKLQSGDRLTVGERVNEFRGSVVLSGNFYRPRKVKWRPNLRLTDVVSSLEQLRPSSQLSAVLVVREVGPNREITTLTADLLAAIRNPKSSSNIALQPQDKIEVLPLSEEREELLQELTEQIDAQATAARPAQLVSINGLVRFPGDYPLTQNMTLAQLVEMAGGLDESAYILNAGVTRTMLDDPENTPIEHFEVSLLPVASELSASEFALSSRDAVNIRQKPEYREFESVTITGEVKFPGEYRIKKGETLTNLMKRVGGFTEYAHIDGVIFTREELKEREEKQIQVLEQQLKSDIANAQLEQSNTGKAANLSSLETLSSSLAQTEALGRLVIDLESILAEESQDLILKGGDVIAIPAFRQEVSVVGQVQYPTAHLFDGSLTFDEYIERSGGETDKADDERIYVVKANGAVVLPNRSGWVNATGVNIEPGDTIVVPLDVDAVDNLSLWTQVSQIVYQVAIGIAAAGNL